MLDLFGLGGMVTFWIIALVVFLVAEGLTAALVSVWFCGGSVAALIAAGFGAPVWLQIALFLVVSGVLLALLGPIARRVARPGKTALNADRHIGRQALVTQEIDNLHGTGAVKLDGVEWTAKSESGDVIPVDTVITVLRISGPKVYVTPAPEE